MRPRRASLVACCLVVLLVACHNESGPPQPRPVARVDVSVAHLLLVPSRPAATLTARAFDASGTEVPGVSVVWASSDEAIARVDATGAVQSQGPVGSTVVTATVAGVTSAGVLVVVATPVAGAVLLDDANIVGEPSAIDPPGDFTVGWRYRVTLTGVPAPTPGTVVVALGNVPVNGRVLSSAASAGGVDVTLEVVTLDDLFEALVVKARVPLAAVPTASSTSQGLARALQLGPFECTSTIEPTLVQLSLPQSTYTARVDLVVDYDGRRDFADRFREFRIEGELKVDAVVAVSLNAAVSGELECLAELVSFPIPGAGLPIFGANVPVGVGFSGALSTTVANLGAQLHVVETYGLNEGFVCPSGPDSRASVHSPPATVTGGIEPIGTWPSNGVRAELAAFGFGWAKLAFGVPWSKRLRAEAIEVKAGLRASLDVAPRERQVAEKDYHSGITLALHGEAELASGVERLKKLLNVKFVNTTASVDVPLSHVPQGTFTAQPAQVPSGGVTSLELQVDDTTALLARSVDFVELVGTTLKPACQAAQLATAQARYACNVTLSTDGPHVFYAFVNDTADRSGFSFELGDDAPVTVRAGADVTAMTRLSVRFGAVSYTLAGDGTPLCQDTTHGGFVFLTGDHGTFLGNDFTASFDVETPPGSTFGHRKEHADFTLSLDPTHTQLTAFAATHTLIGYEDDPGNNWQKEELHLEWLGGPLPSVAPFLGAVDFEAAAPATPQTMRFEVRRTLSNSTCARALSTWSVNPDAYIFRVGLSP